MVIYCGQGWKKKIGLTVTWSFKPSLNPLRFEPHQPWKLLRPPAQDRHTVVGQAATIDGRLDVVQKHTRYQWLLGYILIYLHHLLLQIFYLHIYTYLYVYVYICHSIFYIYLVWCMCQCYMHDIWTNIWYDISGELVCNPQVLPHAQILGDISAWPASRPWRPWKIGSWLGGSPHDPPRSVGWEDKKTCDIWDKTPICRWCSH